MRKIVWFVFCVVVCSSLVFSQSITVTKPAANEVWFKGETHNITWTKSGTMANQVDIALVNPSTREIVHTIATLAPNNGIHPWPIPLTVPNGRYRIAIRTRGENITGVSAGFDIRAKTSVKKPTPVPKTPVQADPKVTITQPDSNDRWNFGDTKDIFIETTFDAQYFRMDLTTSKEEPVFPIYEGALSRLARVNVIRKYRYTWDIPVQSADDGYYKVRIRATSNEGEIVGLSDRFYLSEDVTMIKDVLNLDPIVVNRFEPQKGSKPLGLRLKVGSAWIDETWVVYLAQCKFPFGEIKRKKHILLSATLLLTKLEHNTRLVQDTCANELYVLTAPWTDFSTSPRFLYKTFPEATLGGMRYEFDVLQQVRAWISDQEPNYGFLLSFDSSIKDVCVTQFGAKLQLEYMYKE